MTTQAPSKDQLATYLEHCANLADKPLDGVAYVSVGKLREVVQLLRATGEPRADGCEVCAKPLPPVGAWSMPSCPDCQEVLGFLGELQADFAERDRTQKAEMVGNAIRLICSRTAPPPGLVAKFRVGDTVCFGMNRATWQVMNVRIRYDIGIDGETKICELAESALTFPTKGSAPDWRNQLGQYEASPTGDDDK